ncbi:alpha-amylase family glycosyl hydrolase [Paraburkholderia bryophila]|uniref:Alpha-glucosidase n=1 Tax=Paraburkholderia bryophila TaxID=420952 RepID=A0A329CUK2_9BURK|nr:alpha-amylase family glycosyl hydrolase [Paraburkholderia bryophila]RAS37522.1 alpha-glucosidase [Paraburkholderia bryophila]
MTALAWWQKGVIYQVYPRSFQDEDGDGVGDLAGITARLEYLATLGVDAIWLSPIYPSPMADFGYDIADYCAVDPVFGTLSDFDRLVERAHVLGLKILVDFVPNHSSDQHPWFLESRASRANAKRDWYLWRDPASGGGPPNNWLSRMGGSAWQWDPSSGQYYYHSFLPQQPDLNWRNPEVCEAMDAVLHFWLDRDVDGFRVDVLWLLIKDALFRDNPPNPQFRPDEPGHHAQLQTYTEDQPEVHTIVRSMRRTLDSYGERVLIGEIYLPVPQLVRYYGSAGDGVDMPFNFQLITAQWTASNIAQLITAYERALPVHAWPNWVLGNHDNPRVASRIGASQARVAAMLLLTLRGTPTMYYGDEIGMTDGEIPPEQVRDPAELRQPGIGQGRDPERTPMQWDLSGNAGFTRGKPWLPIGNSAVANVASQDGESWSILALYRQLLSLRRSEPALVAGLIEKVSAQGHVLTFERCLGSARLFVALNMEDRPGIITSPVGRVVLSTHEGRGGHRIAGELILDSDQGIVVACD